MCACTSMISKDTAEEWPALPVTLPPTPWQAATLVDGLAALVTALSAAELREAAEGLPLTVSSWS
ncbi:hypothetical protein [Streptomyces niveus]|uniref:hypothetical protein n=1 Tax=Streptomyces niveus TaxID=193462 RepID=UPI00342724D1